MRTAPDVFNIWFRRTKGCELTYAELTSILTSNECGVNPDFEGLPLNFMQEVYEALSFERENMLKYERIKKVWDKSKNYPILFGLSTENAYICIAFRGKSSLTWTLLQHDANTTPPRHKHFSTLTILLHRFRCFCAPTESQWVNEFTQIFTKVLFTAYLRNIYLFNLLKSFQSLWTSQK